MNEGTLASNYEITTVNGTLTVEAVKTEVKVEIAGHTDTVTYDGQVHSVSGYDVTNISNKLYSDTAISFTGTAVVSRIVAGTSYMGLTAAQFSNTSANFTNVTFVVHDGWLKIDPKSIIPDGPDTPDEKKTGVEVTKPADSKYDGNVHENKPVVKDTKTGATLVEGTDYTLSYSEDVINAGTVTVTITGKGNYSQETTVDYQITPRTVKLTSGSDSKTYDGTPLVKHNVTPSEDGFVMDDGATYEFTGSQTNVGESDNTFTYALKDGTLASNYIITTEAGKLTVTPVTDEVTVTIKEHSAEHVYDGNEKTVTGYDVKSISNQLYTEDDFTFNGTAEAKGTNVGEYPMNVQASDFTNNSNNFAKVTFVIEDGSLKITPKSIVPSETNGMEVTGPADTKYNGDEQKLTPVVKDQGKVLTENVDYKLSYTGDTTNVGTVKITIKGKGNYNGSTEVSYKGNPQLDRVD